MDKQEREIRKKIAVEIRNFFTLCKEKKKFVPGKTKIHYAGRVYDYQEMIAAADAVLEFNLTLGGYGRKFEKRFAQFLGIKNVILTNSGSSANLLAVAALKSKLLDKPLNDGDEVITPACTFPTTLNPIIQLSLTPVFVDVDLGSYNLNLDQLEKAIGPKTRLIMLVHTLGSPNNMKKIMELAKKHNLFVIEDTCDALGSKFKGRLVGTFGDISTYSFYPAHHITMGEGGALATNSPLLKRIIVSLRDWGRACWCQSGETNPSGACGHRFDFKTGGVPYDHKYMYDHIGYNLKPTDIQAAIGVAQLKKLPLFIKTRKKNFQKLNKIFSQYTDYFILPKAILGADVSWFAFPLTIKDQAPFDRPTLIRFLEKNNIETRPLFAGNILYQPAYKNINYRKVGKLVNSNIILRNTFFIGVYPGLGNQEIDYIAEKITDFLRHKHKRNKG